LQFIVKPVSYPINPYCGSPPAPEPTFAFPDTLCSGGSGITSASAGNRLAQAREWHLTGPSTDTLVRDALEFTYQFTEPGDYLLRQTVWVLGCAYSHERSVTVLPQLTVSIIAGDSTICPGEPLEIGAVANRAVSFSWDGPSSAGQGSTFQASTSGVYAVTATDGHCEASDSATVAVVSELLGGHPPFALPNDTVTCLPFLLEPASPFTDQFLMGNNPVPAASFLLGEPGTYRIGAEVFGCMFWEEFEYGHDCRVDVYVPTAFSPNGDGLNDEFLPYGGAGFELLELSVYDRWGGLRHRGGAWDGGTAAQGIYTYKLTYRNLKSGETVETAGEVLLLR
jgi:hypothetical protein